MGAIAEFIEKRAGWAASDERWWHEIGWGRRSATGVQVTETSALYSSAVFACVRLLAETVASLPLPIYKRKVPRGKERAYNHPLYPLLHDSPNPWTTSYNFREALQGHLCTWGNAYAEIDWDMRTGRARALWQLRPDRMKVGKENNHLIYVYTLPDGTVAKLDAFRIWHIPGFGFDGLVGYSPIQLAREAIGLSLATEEFGARFFGNGAKPGGVLEHPNKLTKQAQDNLRDSWNEMHQGLSNQHRIAILEEGMKYQQVGIPPEDAQFLETRKFQTNEIARFFHIPPHMIGDLDRATFGNIEQQSLEFVIYTLRPWLVRWEQSAHLKLMGPEERQLYFVEFLVEGLLRGDFVSRNQGYATARQWGWMSANDIRELENMNPLPDNQGDIYLIPMNMIPAGEASMTPPKMPVNYNAKREMSPEDWKEAYEGGTPHWAIDMDPSLFAQDFVQELKSHKLSSKLLEIGCGNGRDSIFFAKAGFNVSAVDIAPGAIDLAKKNAQAAEVQIDFQEANAEKLPFEDSTFAAVFTLSVLHSTNLNKSIPETIRVLKGHGLLFVYIYGSTESVDGTTEQTITVDAFMQLLKDSGYEILDFYSEQQEQYDEAGEKHQILVALAEKI